MRWEGRDEELRQKRKFTEEEPMREEKINRITRNKNNDRWTQGEEKRREGREGVKE